MKTVKASVEVERRSPGEFVVTVTHEDAAVGQIGWEECETSVQSILEHSVELYRAASDPSSSPSLEEVVQSVVERQDELNEDTLVVEFPATFSWDDLTKAKVSLATQGMTPTVDEAALLGQLVEWLDDVRQNWRSRPVPKKTLLPHDVGTSRSARKASHSTSATSKSKSKPKQPRTPRP